MELTAARLPVKRESVGGVAVGQLPSAPIPNAQAPESHSSCEAP